MARNRYIKTHSNYVIKGLHQTTNIGNIYERDFMTIADLNSYAPGSLPAYGLNGFKMAVNDGINLKKKHHYGNWVKNEACDGKSMYWSMNCIEDTDVDENTNVAMPKPNLNSVLNFACYGSAYKMIESSVKNIISTFPGELYLTDVKINLNGISYYLVDNPFDIEMNTLNLNVTTDINKLKYFGLSYDKYIFENENGQVGGSNLSWEVKYLNQNPCKQDSDILSMIDLGYPFDKSKPKLLLYYCLYGDRKVLVHDGSYINGKITPNRKLKNEFFSNLKDFEKVLLNQKTNYTAILETPRETERGNVLYKRSYSWPKSKYGNWNIDTSGIGFYNYFNSLLSIGEFYDEYFADNIWRAMTHEAIVNFDWTLSSQDSNGITDVYDTPNPKRMQSFIHVAGRLFDDLKQYIDGISNSNAITYNECGNKPDVLLKDELDNYGWDIKAPLSNLLSKFISDVLYPGHSDGYTVGEANNEFFRRLQINSRYILSAKGTKRSIEMVMAMFGYYSLNFLEHSYHEIKRDGVLKTLKWNQLTNSEQKELLRYSYNMTEYVYVAGENSSLWRNANNIERVKEINKLKLNYDFNNADEYQGLPIREVLVSYKNPDYSWKVWNTDGTYRIEYLPAYKPYLIPWFDRNATYDSDIYFESKGGWGLKQTTIGQFGDYDEVIIDTTDELKVYDESVKYLKFVQTVDDLLNLMYEYPHKNDVYYVYDLTSAQTYDWGYLTKKVNGEYIPETLQTLSHYFVLKDTDYTNILGVLRDEEGLPILEDSNLTYTDGVLVMNASDSLPNRKYGWKNISEEELSKGESIDAKRVYYLESIIENNQGNYPHCGFGNYDDGSTYKNFFKDIFKGAKDEDAFMNIDDNELPNKNESIGFDLEKEIDNVKCWYFSDTLQRGHTLHSISSVEYGSNIINDDASMIRFNQTSVGDGNFVRFTNTRNYANNTNLIGELFNSSQYKLMEPYNMEEDGDTDDEAAANSIINSKHFYIEFIPDMISPDSMYDFIEKSIMHYVKQVIPSTTLLKYYVPMRDMDVNCYHRTYLQSAIITE